MNKKQKYLTIISSILILITFGIWLYHGGEIFTKTEVLVETKDELFGWTESKWVDKFVWGLDLSLAISGIIVISTALLYFFFRRKK
ncbi:LPXTG cell wall anchor domain-containing protein [Melioribacter sp. OK-6-Me]|uniref:LPXTG cell wall anchor domain-containing protein n=1 Tax=unclassified Melioribacter TaxID=2627329 RepID=UPI003ED972D1